MKKTIKSRYFTRTSSWIVASGTTSHITFDRTLFATFSLASRSEVELGTNAKANVRKRRDVESVTAFWKSIPKCRLHNVLQVPDFYFLISVSIMEMEAISSPLQMDAVRLPRAEEILKLGLCTAPAMNWVQKELMSGRRRKFFVTTALARKPVTN